MSSKDSDENEIIGVFPGSVATLVLFVLLILFSSMIGILMVGGLGMAVGLEGKEILSRIADSQISSGERSFLRFSILINHLSMFIIPSILLAWFLRRKKWVAYLSLDRFPKWEMAGLACVFLFAGMPLAQAALWLNKQINLPQWAVSMEDSTAGLISNLLQVDSPYGLLINIFIVAIIPALGEEFVFRGILQKNLGRIFERPHLAVWLAAIIFSAFHMQFEGFMARLMLGALLGYLFYWTKNLWLPIIAHFFVNAIQLILQYNMPDKFNQQSSQVDFQLPWPVILVALIVVVFVGKVIQSQALDRSEPPSYNL